MKPRWERADGGVQVAFSTLNSGLRDETCEAGGQARRVCAFQYPQLGPTR